MSSYHHGNLESALRDEALVLAREGGASSITVRAAARAAGVSHAAAYRHFQGRRHLLAAVATLAMEDLAAALEGAVAADSPSSSGGLPAARIGSLARRYVTWALDDPAAFRVAFSEELWDKSDLPALRAASDRASAPLLNAVMEHVDADSIDEVVRPLAVAIWAQVHGLSMLAVDRQLTQGELRSGDDPLAKVPEDAARAVAALLAGWVL